MTTPPPSSISREVPQKSFRKSGRLKKIVLAVAIILGVGVGGMAIRISLVTRSTWSRMAGVPIGVSAEGFVFPDCSPAVQLTESGGPLRDVNNTKSTPDMEQVDVISWTIYTVRGSAGTSMFSLDLWRVRWVNERMVESGRTFTFRTYFASARDTE